MFVHTTISAAVCVAVAALLVAAAPAHAVKTGPTYYTPEDVKQIRKRAADPSYAEDLKGIIERAERIASLTDEQIWELIPEADLPRALNVCFGIGCPVHGQEVFVKAGHYPWIMSSDKPFKVTCPVGGETYPSNDFESYLKAGRKEKLDTSQAYVDDGFGYVAPDGKRYWFVGFYVFWQLWRNIILSGSTGCAEAYLATGDPLYAHKCAVALARISQVYPKMDYWHQAYHNGKWPAEINGRILDYIWENSTVSNFARCYDIVFDTLDSDKELASIASARGVGHVKEAIEANLLQPAIRDVLEKKIWGNKFELGTLSTLALVLPNDDPAKGATTKQMVDWLLTGPGDLEFTFYNGFDRDGIGGEMSPSYSSIWNNHIILCAENLARLGTDVTSDPKWLRIARGPSEMRLLGNMSPRLGDCSGGFPGAERLVQQDLLQFAVSHFEDPYSANLLLKRNLTRPWLLDRSSPDPKTLKRLAPKDDFREPPYTRDLGGYGLAILELDDGKNQTSATMYYGGTGQGHGHKDRLTIGLHMQGRDVLSEMGYPSHWGPVADYWIKNTPSHYAVMIDEKAQRFLNAGQLTKFADLDGLKVAEARAERVWEKQPGDYRRMIALYDTRRGSTLLIDAYFVEGGSKHDYLFHGLGFGKFSSNCEFVREQGGGTLAGADVDYDEDSGSDRRTSGYQYLKNPRWYNSPDVARFTWARDAGLNMNAWFPKLSFSDVIITDAQPPIKPGYPETMPWIVLRNTGNAGLASIYLGIIEAGPGRPQVADVTPIPSSTPKCGGALIKMRDGSTVSLYVNGSDSEAAYSDGSTMSAALAVADERGVSYVIGDGKLERKDRTALSAEAGWRCTVESVDYANGQIRVSSSSAPPKDLKGSVCLVTNGTASASYSIDSVKKKGGKLEIVMNRGLLTGRYRAKWDPERKVIASDERIAGVYNQFAGHTYDGMYLVSADKKLALAIKGYDTAANTFAVDGDGSKLVGEGGVVYVADIGPGAEVSTTGAAVFGEKTR